MLKKIALILVFYSVFTASYSQATQADPQQLAAKIAQEIKNQTAAFPHFKNFDLENVMNGVIKYTNNANISSAPNPAYEKLTPEERKQNSQTKGKSFIPKHIAQIDCAERDGIALEIAIGDINSFNDNVLNLEPYVKIGEYHVLVLLKGASTEDTEKIKTLIYQIIDAQKANFEQNK